MSLCLLDTTILSNFAHVGRPDLVRVVLNEEAATVPAVMAELRQGESLGFVPRVDWRWLPLLTLTEAEQTVTEQLLTVLDSGEAHCLAVAVSRQARLFTDDLAARRLAQAQGITVSGTVGILLSLLDGKNLSLAEADGLLNTMKEYGYRAPVASLQTYRRTDE